MLSLVLAIVNGVCVYYNYRSWKLTGSKFALGLTIYSGAAGIWCLTGLL